MFGDPGDRHRKIKGDLGITGQPGNRGGVGIMRRGGERDMRFAGQQAGCGIKPDPTRPGQVNLGPGMQIGEIMGRPGGAIDGGQVRFELDQIARHKPRGEPKVAQGVDQQPTAIAARPFGEAEGFLGRLDAGFQPDDIADLARQTGVQADDEIDGAQGIAGDRGQECGQQRACRIDLAINDQIGGDILRVGKRPGLCCILDEKVERVIDGHIRHKINFDPQLIDRVRKNIAGQPVAVHVLLVVHKMLDRTDFERVGHHPGPAMRGRAQPDDLRPKRDRPVIDVVGQVIDTGKDRHGAAGPVVQNRFFTPGRDVPQI